jgi:diketogulonate reductase-like aldo/keto reductase
VLAEVAARHGATPRQVALAFLARAEPLFTIPKASTVAHAEENAGALDLALSADDIAAIDAAFAVRAADELPVI